MYVYLPEFYSKVQMMEDSDGNMHLKNLSLHPAANEEEGEEDKRVGFFIDCCVFHLCSFELAISWRHKQNDCGGICSMHYKCACVYTVLLF